MAIFFLPITSIGRRNLPSWVDKALAKGHVLEVGGNSSIAMTNAGFIWIAEPELYWGYMPVVGDLPIDNFEALIEFERIYRGDTNGSISGGSLFFGSGKKNGASRGYAFSIGSGTSTNTSIVSHNASSEDTTLLKSTSVSGINSDYKKTFIRARVEGAVLKMKVWTENQAEPVGWINEVSSHNEQLTTIGIINAGRRLALRITGMAYATNGDTAILAPPPVANLAIGSIKNSRVGDIVVIHEVETHDVVTSVPVDETGGWTAELFDNTPVYARIERSDSSEYDLLFARYGSSYLGGDAPDGIVKDDGVPTEADIRILYRSDNPILGGVLIDKTISRQSGEWQVLGLQPNVQFDVVARKQNRKDSMVSDVTSLVDPNYSYTLLGGAGYVAYHIKGTMIAKGATPPITVAFTGATPLGLSVSEHVVISGETISINYPMRDYGNFSFDVNVTDGNQVTTPKQIAFLDAERAPFVDFIAAVNSMDRGNTTTPITAVVPSSVMTGDILVIGLMRRGEVLVSDNNSGTWTLGADSFDAAIYNQGASIYYRTAKADDAGKTITVSGPYSGRLIVYLSVYRGKFAPLKVVNTVSNPVRYDDTYSQKIKNLAPIEHDSGFMVRAVSNAFSGAINSSYADIIGMTNTGDVGPNAANQLRLQVSYKHLETGGILSGVTYNTNYSDGNDVIPDVAIILDEVRS